MSLTTEQLRQAVDLMKSTQAPTHIAWHLYVTPMVADEQGFAEGDELTFESTGVRVIVHIEPEVPADTGAYLSISSPTDRMIIEWMSEGDS